ncbi:MAG: hypothetical protein J7501_17315, partial [Bdellovibrio sp.]|nr:hypothetical protein [Bdellovibrio sp.]
LVTKICDNVGAAYWASETARNSGASLQITNTAPYLAVVNAQNVWFPLAQGFSIAASQCAQTGDNLSLCLQADGNLVLYQSGKALWASSYFPQYNTPDFKGTTEKLSCASCSAVFQQDGNIVLYNGKPYWASRTNGLSGARVAISATAPYVSVVSEGQVVWSSSSDRLMQSLWDGTASFKQLVAMQISTTTKSGSTFVNGMNQGTQIVPMNGTWYLFNREYDFAAKPSQCAADFARIMVRTSSDSGKTWSKPVVVAEPQVSYGECALADGYAFYDSEQSTWHYLAQVLTTSGQWNTSHFSLNGDNPLARFARDSANPVISSGSLWKQICGAQTACPNGTAEEGTPEILYKKNGFFYVTFHGAKIASPGVVHGYRGVAKTRDFKNWVTKDADLPNDAIWSPQDCKNWNVSWNSKTGCIGGGQASTLITSQYTYQLIESADTSLSCSAGQTWAYGLVRSNTGLVASGKWEQMSVTPFMLNRFNVPCAIQYARLFQDSSGIYLSYWTLASPLVNSVFHISRLEPGQPLSLDYSKGSLTILSDQSVIMGQYRFILQADGNLVMYDPFSFAVWSSGTSGKNCGNQGCKAVYQSDGNLVLYKNGQGAYWDSGTANRGARLRISARKPYVQILDSAGAKIW